MDIVKAFFACQGTSNKVAWHKENDERGGIVVLQSMLERLLFEEFTDGQASIKYRKYPRTSKNKIIDWFVDKMAKYDHNHFFSTIMTHALQTNTENVIQTVVYKMVQRYSHR